jgi:hypothetical protein
MKKVKKLSNGMLVKFMIAIALSHNKMETPYRGYWQGLRFLHKAIIEYLPFSMQII